MNYFKKRTKNIHIDILISVLFYLLGTAIAHYIGSNVNLIDLMMGGLWVITFLIGLKLMIPILHIESGITTDSDTFSSSDRTQILIWAMLVLLISGFVLLFLMIKRNQQMDLWFLFILSYAGVLLLLPIKRIGIGYIDSLLVIFQSCIFPGVGFFLFSGIYHRLIILILFPMALVLIGLNIANEFSTFANDVTIGRRTLIRVIGWRRGILLHNLLIAIGIVMLLINIGRGIPSVLIWPIGLTIPLAIGDIIWLQRIRLGNKPVWPFFNALSYSVICVLLYLTTFTLWVN